MNSTIAACAEVVQGAALVVFGKMTVVLTAALLLLWIARRRSSHLRFLLATAGLLMATTLPVWERLVPVIRLPLCIPALDSTAWKRAPESTPATSPSSHELGPPTLTGSAADQRSLSPAHDHPGATSRIPLLLVCGGVCWLLGTLRLTLLRLRDLGRIRALTRQARPQLPLQQTTTRLAMCLGIQATVRCLIHPAVRVPLSWGFRTPTVLLPEEALHWQPERLRIILTHELVHVRRHDYWFLWAIECARSLYWVHPLVPFLARRASIERELACDDAVVRHGIEPDRYASTLLDLARASRNPQPSVALAFHGPRGLADRVHHILEPGSPERNERFASFAFAGLLALTTLGAAPWTPGTAPDPAARAPFAPLHDPSARVRQRVAWSLGEREDASAVEALTEALHDEHPEVRGVAAWSLGEIKDVDALPALYSRLEDQDCIVREMIIRAIGEHEQRGSFPVLRDQLRAEEPSLRAAVVWSLGEIGGSEARTLLESLEDPHPAVRVEVLRVLARRPGLDTRRRLLRALSDEDPDVRATACRILGQRGDAAAVDALLRALRDPALDVRSAASWALDEINPSRNRP